MAVHRARRAAEVPSRLRRPAPGRLHHRRRAPALLAATCLTACVVACSADEELTGTAEPAAGSSLASPPASELLLPVPAAGPLAGDAALLRDAARAWDIGTEATYEQGRYPFGPHQDVAVLFAGRVDGRAVVLLQGLAQASPLQGAGAEPLPRVALAVQTPGGTFDPDLGVTDSDVVPPGAETPTHPVPPLVPVLVQTSDRRASSLLVVTAERVRDLEVVQLPGAAGPHPPPPADGWQVLPLDGRVSLTPYAPPTGQVYVRATAEDGLRVGPVALLPLRISTDGPSSVPTGGGQVLATTTTDGGAQLQLVLTPDRTGAGRCLVIRDDTPTGDESLCQYDDLSQDDLFELGDGLWAGGPPFAGHGFGTPVLAGLAESDVVAVVVDGQRVPTEATGRLGPAARAWIAPGDPLAPPGEQLEAVRALRE